MRCKTELEGREHGVTHQESGWWALGWCKVPGRQEQRKHPKCTCKDSPVSTGESHEGCRSQPVSTTSSSCWTHDASHHLQPAHYPDTIQLKWFLLHFQDFAQYSLDLSSQRQSHHFRTVVSPRKSEGRPWTPTSTEKRAYLQPLHSSITK